MKGKWKRTLSAFLAIAMTAALLVAPAGAAEQAERPVLAADGSSFTYQGESVTLGPKAIYVDGRLSAEEAAKSDYVFTSFNEAVAHLTAGTEAEPMNLYLAPYVYWIHDPQAAEATNMTGATQMVIECANLHITGLAEDPQDVVVAANFGHDVGFFNGNYTMFNIKGDGLTLKNMTFGDYCNVDLVYPADPTLNVSARAPENITQGQIGWYDGDKLYAENVRFISRLNMMPFNNNQRALYVNCHMECTDDALNGSSQAVYLGCDFDFYSSKPWYSSGGVTLLGCTMRIIPKTPDAQSVNQYLAKAASPFTVIDCSFQSDVASTTIGWSDVFDEVYKSYYANVDLNGTPITFSGGSRPDAGVDITGKDALKAFKLADGTYNVYNLLRGGDDWDPLGQKDAVTAAGAADLPVSMDAYAVIGETTSRYASMESGGENGVLTLGYYIVGPQSTDYNAAANVTWSVKEEDKQFVELAPNADGTCQVTGINTTEETSLVVVTARDASGLEAAVSLYVSPSILPAPTFDQAPAIVLKDGAASVTYTYTAESIGDRPDNARIAWSVCDDAQGTNPIKIAVGRTETPLDTIPLTQAMVGKHLMVTVESKHRRSDYGDAVTAVSAAPVAAQDAPAFDGALKVDIATFPVDTQKEVIPGFWTVDSYKPADAEPDGAFSGGNWTTEGESRWGYGTGVKNGTKDITGIFNSNRGARLMYTPLEDMDREMDLTVMLAPGKTAGQGFGSAKQYMDFMVKYDPANHTGWGLRIYRQSGSTCCFSLVSHAADGSCTLLTDPAVESSMFLTMVTVHIWTLNDELHATVTSTNTDTAKNPGPVELSAKAPELSACVEGGVELNHTGTAGDNSIYITAIDVQWPERGAVAPSPAEPDKTELTAAIAQAQAALTNSPAIQPAGTAPADVTDGTKFVYQSDKDALTAAIAKAQAVADSDEAVQDDVDKAETELKAAVDAFNAAIQTGTKSTSTGGGSVSRRTDTSATSGSNTQTQADGTVVTTTKDATGTTVTAVAPDGSEIETVTKADGEVSITATAADGEVVAEVTIPASIPAPETKFEDVPEGHWAEESINNMAGLGIVKGVGDNSYDMDSDVTRGALATMLFRFANGKEGKTNNFADVASGQWYTDAIAWAADVGVVTGYSDTSFGPDDTITREQLAVMLWRFAKLLGADVSDTASLSQFTDSAAVGDWAAEAMAWAVGSGVIKGKGADTLDPAASTTRAQTAAMLDRFIGLMK